MNQRNEVRYVMLVTNDDGIELAGALGYEGLQVTPQVQDDLGAAWAAAELALPEDWRLLGVQRTVTDWQAAASNDGGTWSWNPKIGRGDTPATALRALAAALADASEPT